MDMQLMNFHSSTQKYSTNICSENTDFCVSFKVRKRAKIRNRYNQAPHLTQDTNGKVTASQLRERSGSVVECLTLDRRAAGSSLTGVTSLWSLSKTHLS